MDISYRVSQKPIHCELCERPVATLTKHHLIPRTRHGKKHTQRLFDRQDMRTRILWVCRSCHNHIHDVLTEKELALHFNTRERLLTHPSIHRFAEWIRQRPSDFQASSRPMRRF